MTIACLHVLPLLVGLLGSSWQTIDPTTVWAQLFRSGWAARLELKTGLVPVRAADGDEKDALLDPGLDGRGVEDVAGEIESRIDPPRVPALRRRWMDVAFVDDSKFFHDFDPAGNPQIEFLLTPETELASDPGNGVVMWSDPSDRVAWQDLAFILIPVPGSAWHQGRAGWLADEDAEHPRYRLETGGATGTTLLVSVLDRRSLLPVEAVWTTNGKVVFHGWFEWGPVDGHRMWLRRALRVEREQGMIRVTSFGLDEVRLDVTQDDAVVHVNDSQRLVDQRSEPWTWYDDQADWPARLLPMIHFVDRDH